MRTELYFQTCVDEEGSELVIFPTVVISIRDGVTAIFADWLIWHIGLTFISE